MRSLDVLNVFRSSRLYCAYKPFARSNNATRAPAASQHAGYVLLHPGVQEGKRRAINTVQNTKHSGEYSCAIIISIANIYNNSIYNIIRNIYIIINCNKCIFV